MTTRARRVLVVALAVVLVVAGASYGLWRARRQVPMIVDPACPALLTHTSNGSDDYGDTVHWAGRTYWSTEARTAVGTEQLGVVTCSINDIPNQHGWSIAPGEWPDGTATALPRGTTLHAARGHDATALVARTAKGDRLYCVDDGAAGPPAC